MDFMADGLLLIGTLTAVFYCYALSKRIKNLSNLDSGLGGAITALSAQVDEMKQSFDAAKKISGSSVEEMKATAARAEIAAGRLELLLATLHENADMSKSGDISQRRKTA